MLGLLGLRLHPVVRLLLGGGVIALGAVTDRRAFLLIGAGIVVYGLVGLVGLLSRRSGGSQAGTGTQR